MPRNFPLLARVPPPVRKIWIHGLVCGTLLMSALPCAAQTEPVLIKSSLRLAPTAAQMATWPDWPALWLLPAAFNQDPATQLRDRGFRPELAAELARRMQPVTATAEQGTETRLRIVPDRALLATFTPSERERWHLLLATQYANVGSRWPLVLDAEDLAKLADLPGGQVVADLVRTYSVQDDAVQLWRLHDPWILRDALRDPATRPALLERLLSARVVWAKARTSGDDPATVRADAAYWQSHGRFRAIEPILQALGAVADRDRIDLLHLLPRLPRALLNSYPLALDRTPELTIDNARAVAGFFGGGGDLDADRDLSTWLGRRCEPVTSRRAFGDVVVFEDPARTRWPFAAVYVADGLVFGRRPTLTGPWGLWRIADLIALNPRLGAMAPLTFRPRDPAGPALDDFEPLPPPPIWLRPTTLRPLAAGPWGRLWTYDIFLAPSANLLAQLPEPSAEPLWGFRRWDEKLQAALLGHAALTPAQREQLRQLFAASRPGADGTQQVRPPVELVRSLPAAWRSEAYRFLRGSGSITDYFQEMRVIHPLTAADLPASVASGLPPLIYPRNGRYAVGDYGLIYHLTKDREDRVAMLQALCRTPARIVLLERPAPSEVSGIAAYWEVGGRKDLDLLLGAFADQTEISYLDISHLLPSLAREYMNLFVLPVVDQPVPSCYWTALNFNQPVPDPRFLIVPGQPGDEVAVVESALRQNYDRIDAPARPGDVIAYYDRNTPRAPIHVCSYLAADLVFTKNGFGYDAPWCIAPRNEVDDLYRMPGSGETRYYRLRPVPTQPSAAK